MTQAGRPNVEAIASPPAIKIALASSLPTIAGVLVLAILVLGQKGVIPEHALLRAFFAVSWMPAFLGAAYGPVLLPIGAMALLVTRRRNGKKNVVVGWVLIALGLLATAASYLWVLDAVELP